jgi:hypothetical protein
LIGDPVGPVGPSQQFRGHYVSPCIPCTGRWLFKQPWDEGAKVRKHQFRLSSAAKWPPRGIPSNGRQRRSSRRTSAASHRRWLGTAAPMGARMRVPAGNLPDPSSRLPR